MFFYVSSVAGKTISIPTESSFALDFIFTYHHIRTMKKEYFFHFIYIFFLLSILLNTDSKRTHINCLGKNFDPSSSIMLA